MSNTTNTGQRRVVGVEGISFQRLICLPLSYRPCNLHVSLDCDGGYGWTADKTPGSAAMSVDKDVDEEAEEVKVEHVVLEDDD